MTAQIPANLKTWSTTAASNQPDYTDAPGPNNLADELRQVQSVVRYMMDTGTIASAATTDLGTIESEAIGVTGTTTITAFGTVSAGIRKKLRFAGVLTLTYNATSMILSGGTNVTTEAGDWCEVESLGAGNWRMLWYFRASGLSLGSQASDATLTALSGVTGPLSGFRNRLVNPRGAVYQIAVASTADDSYYADGWYALTQTGAATPAILTDPEDGYPTGVRLTQSQATAQRFGFAQIIEGKNCKDLRGGSGVLAPRIRISNSQPVRYAILGWTGTEDSVTSDVVLDWTSASYTAGGFFLASNVSVLAVGAQTPSANTWTTLASLSAALGSSFNNLIVMVWTEGTAAQNVTLDFDYMQMEVGTKATPFEFRDADTELRLAKRFYQLITQDHGFTSNGASHFSRTPVTLPVEMRATPTAATVSTGTLINVSGNPTMTPRDARSAYSDITAVTSGSCSSMNTIYSMSARL